MRFGSIGDTHGRPFWMDFINKNPHIDKWILIGDFPDSNKYTPVEILHNLKEIIHYKKNNPDKVILLLGNHCLQYAYLPDSRFRCSGFRPEIAHDLHQLYKENKDLFQVAYQYKNHIWTHAGISNTWYDRHKDIIQQYGKKYGAKNLADCLNIVNGTSQMHILHEVGHRRGGYLASGGITWADFRETVQDCLLGYHQICGHTSVKDFIKEDYGAESITYIDCLGTVQKFYEHEVK